jgi:hypothetical protein
MHIWLDENCGADALAMALAGPRGVGNEAVAVYFLDAPSRRRHSSPGGVRAPRLKSTLGHTGCVRISQRGGWRRLQRRFRGLSERAACDLLLRLIAGPVHPSG